MASNIDPLVPVFGNATTASQRANWAAAKAEIEALQAFKAPYGFVYFENIAFPYTLTYPAAYAKVNPVTVAPNISHQVTEGTNARLTFLGPDQVMDIQANVSVDQASGADKDLIFSIYKNGVILPGATAIITCVSGSKRFVSVYGVGNFTSGDYVELYAKNDGASGDLRVYTLTLALDPH